MDAAKQERNRKIDEDMKKATDENYEARKREHLVATDAIRQQRRAEKAVKRALNIEIASEILDLVTDMADEAYNYLEENKHLEDEQEAGDEAHLIKKAKWRHWLKLFGDGKKVSEENLVIQDDQLSSQKQAQLDSMAQLLSGSSTAAMTPYRILSDMRNESIFDDLLQYIC